MNEVLLLPSLIELFWKEVQLSYIISRNHLKKKTFPLRKITLFCTIYINILCNMTPLKQCSIHINKMANLWICKNI